MPNHGHGHKKEPKGPTTGNFAPAPAGAPTETSQPLGSGAIEQMLAKARANEQVLKPLTPVSGGPGPGVPTGSGSTPSVGPGVPPAPDLSPTPAPQAGSDAPSAQDAVLVSSASGAELEGLAGLAGLAKEFSVGGAGASTPAVGPDPAPGGAGPRRPAESNSDSPSRGVPRPILDPTKKITGGWGADGGGGQYYALDGAELQNVITVLMRGLESQMAGDLRLGMAVVYPQVRVRVQIQIDGSTPDAPVNDARFDLAQARLLTLESLAQDDDQTPADQLRDDAGLTKPHKQIIRAGATHLMVDVAHPLAGAES